MLLSVFIYFLLFSFAYIPAQYILVSPAAYNLNWTVQKWI